MLRVVADANVLISAALARSPNAPSVQTLDAALDGQSTLLADAPPPFPAVCSDPDDDYLVALATAHHANALVTGDDDLLAIDPAHSMSRS